MSEQPPDEKNQGEKPGEEFDLPEAAPTDYRGNAWLLAFMVGVVIIAWLVGQLRHMF